MNVRKKIIPIAIIIVISSALFAICMLRSKTTDDSKNIILNNRYSRESYLNLNGRQVTELGCETIRVPACFDGIYEKYAEIQEKQGLPLENYKGEEVKRYTYSVDNYGGNKNVCAELLVYENRLIAAALIEQSPDGFIEPAGIF
ncbi:MAG: DUF4830 domain-containing protein [Porcipelethomonas sp.]